MSPDLDRDIVDWLVAAALESADENALLTALAERLNAAGFDLSRVFVGTEVFHPQVEARSFIWRPGGAIQEDYDFQTMDEVGDGWTRSPLYYLLDNGLGWMRLRLDELGPGRFPLLERLRDEGCTDYAAAMRNFAPQPLVGEVDGVMASWTTTRPGGFADTELAVLQRSASPLALAFKGMAAMDVVRTHLSRA